MPVIRSHQEYFTTIRDFNTAEPWQQEILIRGSLLSKCKSIEPASIRLRLRRFWDMQATRLGVSVGQLKTWR